VALYHIIGSRRLDIQLTLSDLLVSQELGLGLREGSSVTLEHVLILHSFIADGQLESLLRHKVRLHYRGPILGHLDLGNRDNLLQGSLLNFDGARYSVALTKLIPAVVLNDALKLVLHREEFALDRARELVHQLNVVS
jgi:hypothetical protein